MLHACAVRFDVTENLENFLDFGANLVAGRGLLTCRFDPARKVRHLRFGTPDLIMPCRDRVVI